jgi:cofilin
MTSSGVSVDQGAIEAFNSMKQGKTATYLKLRLCKAGDVPSTGSVGKGANGNYLDREAIVVDCVGGAEATFDDFKTVCMIPGEACFAIYDVKFETSDGRPQARLCLISWIPEDAPGKVKMVMAGSKETLKKALTGIAAEVQATDSEEGSLKNIVDKIKSKMTQS